MPVKTKKVLSIAMLSFVLMEYVSKLPINTLPYNVIFFDLHFLKSQTNQIKAGKVSEYSA